MTFLCHVESYFGVNVKWWRICHLQHFMTHRPIRLGKCTEYYFQISKVISSFAQTVTEVDQEKTPLATLYFYEISCLNQEGKNRIIFRVILHKYWKKIVLQSVAFPKLKEIRIYLFLFFINSWVVEEISESQALLFFLVSLHLWVLSSTYPKTHRVDLFLMHRVRPTHHFSAIEVELSGSITLSY